MGSQSRYLPAVLAGAAVGIAIGIAFRSPEAGMTLGAAAAILLLFEARTRR